MLGYCYECSDCLIPQPQSAALVFQGIGGGAINKHRALGRSSALLATMSYAKPQFETFSKEKKNPRDRLFVLLL